MIHLSIDLTIALEHVNDWTYRPLAFQGGRVAIIMNEIICRRLSSIESLESNRLICFSATGNFSFFFYQYQKVLFCGSARWQPLRTQNTFFN